MEVSVGILRPQGTRTQNGTWRQLRFDRQVIRQVSLSAGVSGCYRGVFAGGPRISLAQG